MDMDFVIKDLGRRFSLTVDEVKQELSPEYDIIQRCNHTTVEVLLHGETYNIDEKLVNLFKLINKYDMNTTMSCQHNWFGWANISFSSESYLRFVNKIVEKALEKYHDDRDKIYELNIIRRFQYSSMYQLKSNTQRICTSSYIYENEDEGIFQFIDNININLIQSEIPKLESELSELFN